MLKYFVLRSLEAASVVVCEAGGKVMTLLSGALPGLH